MVKQFHRLLLDCAIIFKGILVSDAFEERLMFRGESRIKACKRNQFGESNRTTSLHVKGEKPF
jgi:hypothetical protein